MKNGIKNRVEKKNITSPKDKVRSSRYAPKLNFNGKKIKIKNLKKNHKSKESIERRMPKSYKFCYKK